MPAQDIPPYQHKHSLLENFARKKETILQYCFQPLRSSYVLYRKKSIGCLAELAITRLRTYDPGTVQGYILRERALGSIVLAGPAFVHTITKECTVEYSEQQNFSKVSRMDFFLHSRCMVSCIIIGLGLGIWRYRICRREMSPCRKATVNQPMIYDWMCRQQETRLNE